MPPNPKLYVYNIRKFNINNNPEVKLSDAENEIRDTLQTPGVDVSAGEINIILSDGTTKSIAVE